MFSKTFKSVVAVAGAALSVSVWAAPGVSNTPISQADWLQQELASTDGNSGPATYVPQAQNWLAKDTKDVEHKQAAPAAGKTARTTTSIEMEMMISDGAAA